MLIERRKDGHGMEKRRGTSQEDTHQTGLVVILERCVVSVCRSVRIPQLNVHNAVSHVRPGSHHGWSLTPAAGLFLDVIPNKRKEVRKNKMEKGKPM